MKILINMLLVLSCSVLLCSCGDTSRQAPAGGSLKAVIKPTALTADRNIAGINLSISLPAGVVPPLLPDGSADPAATVEITSSASPGQSLPGATYTPATASAQGQLVISAIVASGFSAADAITIHLKVAVGAFPVESDFRLLTFDAFDINGAPVTGLNPTLTTTIQ